MDAEKLGWRSFADVPSKDRDSGNLIRRQWNIQGTPTLYLIDHKGIIRHRWLGSPGEKVLDVAIHKLIQEARKDSK